MFDRFTEPARHVIVLAGDEARILQHNYVGTEHILLALLREQEGIAARVLGSLDVSVEKVRAQVVRTIGTGEDAPNGQIPFTPRAKKVLELAQREAVSLGHPDIDTEHLLLGLLKEGEGVAARVLLDLDVAADAVRARMLSMMHEPRAEPKPVQMPVQMPLRRSPEVERMLDMAAREAERDRSPEVRLRHIVRAIAEFFGR